MASCDFIPKTSNKNKLHYDSNVDSVIFTDIMQKYDRRTAISVYKEMHSDRFKAIHGDWVNKPHTYNTYDMLATAIEQEVDSVITDNVVAYTALATIDQIRTNNEFMLTEKPKRVYVDIANYNEETANVLQELIANNVDMLITDRSASVLLYLSKNDYKNYTILTSTQQNTNYNDLGEPILSDVYLADFVGSVSYNQNKPLNKKELKAKRLQNLFSSYGVEVDVVYTNDTSNITYRNGKAVININDIPDSELTVAHEFAHLYIDLLSPELRNISIAELQGTELHEAVKAESKAWENNDVTSSNLLSDKINRETLARAVEQEYEALSKSLLKRIYTYMAAAFKLPMSKSRKLAYDLLKNKLTFNVSNIKSAINIPTYVQNKLTEQEYKDTFAIINNGVKAKIAFNANARNVDQLTLWRKTQDDMHELDKITSFLEVANNDLITIKNEITDNSAVLRRAIDNVKGYEPLLDAIDTMLNEYQDMYEVELNGVKSTINVKVYKTMSAELRKTLKDLERACIKEALTKVSTRLANITTNPKYKDNANDLMILLKESSYDISLFARWLDTLDETNDTILQSVEKLITEAKEKARLNTRQLTSDTTIAFDALQAKLGIMTAENEQSYFDFMLEHTIVDGVKTYGRGYIAEYSSTYDVERKKYTSAYYDVKSKYDTGEATLEEVKTALNAFVDWQNENTEREFTQHYYDTFKLSDETKEVKDIIDAEMRSVKSKYVRKHIDNNMLSEADTFRLAILKVKKKQLSSLYYTDGTRKGTLSTQEDAKALRIAEELIKHNENYTKYHTQEQAVDEFNLALDEAKQLGREADFIQGNTMQQKTEAFYTEQSELTAMYVNDSEKIQALEELNNEKKALLAMIRDNKSMVNPTLLNNESYSLKDLQERIYAIEKEEYAIRYGDVVPKVTAITKSDERFILNEVKEINEEMQAISRKYDTIRYSFFSKRKLLRGLKYSPSDLTAEDEVALMEINNEEKYEKAIERMKLPPKEDDESGEKEDNYTRVPQMQDFEADKLKATDKDGVINPTWLRYNEKDEYSDEYKQALAEARLKVKEEKNRGGSSSGDSEKGLDEYLAQFDRPENWSEERKAAEALQAKKEAEYEASEEGKAKRTAKFERLNRGRLFTALLNKYRDETGHVDVEKLITDEVEKLVTKTRANAVNNGTPLTAIEVEASYKATRKAYIIKLNKRQKSLMTLTKEDDLLGVMRRIEELDFVIYNNDGGSFSEALNSKAKSAKADIRFTLTDTVTSQQYKDALKAAMKMNETDRTAWIMNNHVFERNRRKQIVTDNNGKPVLIPTDMWHILEPKDKTQIYKAPADRWVIYVPKDKIVNAEKTAAYRQYHENVKYTNTDYYNKELKRINDGVANGTISKAERIAWIDNNHKFNKFSGELEPISMWKTSIATNERHNETVYTSNWQKSVVNDKVDINGVQTDLRNADYRLKADGKPVPKPKWKNKAYTDLLADKSDKGVAKSDFYKFYVEAYNKAQMNYAPTMRMGEYVPTVIKDDSGTAWEKLKDEFNRFTDIRYDGKDNIAITDQSGKKVYTLRAMYSKRLLNDNGEEDYNERDNNLAKTLLMYTASANKHREFKEIEADLMLIQDFLGDRNVESDSLNPFLKKKNTIKGGMSYAALTDYMVQNFYQQRDNNSAGTFSVGKSVFSIDKLLSRVKEYESIRTLGFGLRAGIANVLQGEITQIREAVANEYYGMSAYRQATAIYAGDVVDIMADSMRHRTGSKVNKLNELFDTFVDIDNALLNKVFGERSTFSKLMKKSTLFFINSSGEHLLQSRTMLSILLSHNFNDSGALVRVNNSDEAIYNSINVEDGVLGGLTQEQIIKLSNKIKHVNRIHGNYSKDNTVAVEKNAYGTLLLMYRKWVKTGFNRRFRDSGAYSELGEIEMEGYYTTTARFIQSLIKEREGMSLEMLTESYKSLSDHQKANMRRMYFDMGVILLLHVMVIALANLADDDDDDYVYGAMTFFASRLESEMLFYARFDEAYRIIKSPTASLSLAVDVGKFVVGAMQPFKWADEYKGGKNKDKNKLGVSFGKLIPLWKQYSAITALPEDSKTMRTNELFRDFLGVDKK